MKGWELFRSRDLVMCAVVAVAIVSSLQLFSSQFTIKLSWYLDHKTSLPVMSVDVDNDGLSEIITVSELGELFVVKPDLVADPNDMSVFSPTILAKTTVFSNFMDDSVIGIGVGPLPGDEGFVHRIIVVFGSGTVVCLSGLKDMAVIWTSYIDPSFSERYTSATVLLSPIQALEVHASTSLVDTISGIIFVSLLPTNIRLDEDLTVCALHASTGMTIWCHDSYHRSIQHSETKKDLVPLQWAPRAYGKYYSKLFAVDKDNVEESHAFAGDWTEYKNSIISEFPLRWQPLDRVYMHLSFFSHSTSEKSSSSSRKNLKDRLVSAHDETTKYNALLIQSSSGIEVLSLQAGLPVTHFPLLSQSTVDDVDFDAEFETILFDSNDNASPCTLIAVQGSVPHDILFSSVLSSSAACSGSIPLVLRSIHGHKRVVVSLNNGEVVAVDGVTGHVIWRSKKGPIWQSSSAPFVTAYSSSQDKNMRQEVIIIGQDKLVVLNGNTGSLVGSSVLSRPCSVLLHALLLIDFNHDGHEDIVLCCDGSIWGLEMVRRSSFHASFFLLIFLVLNSIIVFASHVKFDNHQVFVHRSTD